VLTIDKAGRSAKVGGTTKTAKTDKRGKIDETDIGTSD
jgi:hypothetical protein